MRILFVFFILIISPHLFGETYICNYEELNQIKKITLDRVTHSHFKKCVQNNCDNKKYSVVFANNDSLIIGDIEENSQHFFIFIINKNTNFFSAANINLPYPEENYNFNGICEKY